jgi:maleate isomerase
MEPDLHRYLGDTCTISTCRIFLESVDQEAETRMLREDLSRSLRLIKTTAPDVTVFGCTSAGALGGVAHDVQIAQTIEKETESRALTVVQSVLNQLRLIHPRRVALFTPYQEALTRSVAECIIEGGHELVRTAGMGILENRAIGNVTPGEITDFVDSNMVGIEADCIFLSCTNWQALDAIEQLENRYGIPVITSNQSTIEGIRMLATGTIGSGTNSTK